MGNQLTHEQLADLRASFRLVAPISARAAEIFYARLFALDPTLRPLFRDDMAAQGRKLMDALGVVVAGAGDMRRLRATLESLAVRHVGYGVEDRHYETVGEALLWTLEQGLGDAFTEPVRDAWASAFAMVSETMIAAARGARLARGA